MANPLEGLLLRKLEDVATASTQAPWDVLVVGAGTAGLTTARTTAEHGLRTAVFETGPLVLLGHTNSSDLRYSAGLARQLRTALEYSSRPTTSGQTFGRLIRGVGGRGLFWNGSCPRWLREDFADWPIPINDLDAFYAWAERDFRVSRDLGSSSLADHLQRLCRAAGINAEPGPFAVDTRPSRDGVVGGTIANAVSGLLRSGLLTRADGALALVADAFTCRILLANGSAAGLLVKDRTTGTQHEVRGKAVVLTGGGLESVRLAAVSRLPDRSGLVGKRLLDHIFCRAYFPAPPALYNPAVPEAAALLVRHTPGRRFQLEAHAPGRGLFANDADGWRPDLSQDYAVMVRSFGSVEPRDDNALVPLEGDEPGSFTVSFSLGRADLDLRERMLEGLERIRSALGLQPATPEVLPAGSSYHEAGGLAMGTDPHRSVTDPYGRFHQIPSIRALDASAWPSLSPANPHLTIAAVARRQALQLVQDLQTQE